ncbi:MFS transporter [Modestobacter versicolor]|uniref:MFS transporter n=1 Tax=Modestobacter versicolor TaxID=429133 RepID=A0A323VAY8_9ACTN|nr:MFS transporter [Modestobacter versicolor]
MRGGRAPRLLAPVLVLLAAVVAVTSSVGVPFIPAVAELYDAPLALAQWSLTLPFLVGTVATPVLGRLGDGPYRRVVVLGALTLVVLGGVLTALPLPLPAFLAGRALQGFGLSLMPLLMAVAREALPPGRSGPTIAVLSVTVVSGVGLGYPLAGLVAELGGLRAAFWAAAAVCGAALVAAAVVLPAPAAAPRRPFDWPGAVLLGTGLAALLLALSEGGDWGWSSPLFLGTVATCLVALTGWVVSATRSPAPLVDVRLARGRRAAGGHLAILLVSVANYLLIGCVTVLAQAPQPRGLATSVLVAGLLLVPYSLATMAAGQVARRLAERLGGRGVVSGSALVVAVAGACFAVLDTELWHLFLAMAVLGVGVGGAFATVPGLVIAAVPASESSSAMALNQVLRYAGFALGSALTAVVLDLTSPAAGDVGASTGPVIGLATCAVGLTAAGLTWLLTGRAPTSRDTVRSG